ncbi:ncm [Bugula neritina]|uniref:Ncm n=1 Tax=Bugula neritina TaxID=10212 RepID=A0A7J7JEA8_BUGNE|nr:ncm [Bugula neritina]
MLNKIYVEKFEEMFMTQYETCHRLDATKRRNVSKLFAHLLHTDAISWSVLQVIKMNEDDTTSSSRIFVKQLFLEIAEYKGLPKFNERLKDETLQGYFEGIMPKDHPKKTRFAINFFTSIGLVVFAHHFGSSSADSDIATDSDSSSDSE